MKIKWGKLISCLLIGLICYVVVCCIVVPFRHKEESEEYRRRFEGRMTEFMNLQGGENVRLLAENDEALFWRLKTIETADKSLILSTFDMNGDNSGKDVMASLLSAADRGVEVRLIIDGINQWLNLSRDDNFRALISHDNIEAKAYNPINLLKPWRLNYRMHDKYLIADDKICILGGRNTNDLFLGSSSKKPNIDKDVLLYRQPGDYGGRAIEEVTAYFQNNWEKDWSKPLSYRISFNKKEETLKNLRKHYKEMKITCPEAFAETDWQDETYHSDGVMLVTNPVNISNKEPEIWYSLCRIMEEGEEILINTPYIICNNRMYEDLNRLAEGGRKIGFLTNSVENGANPWGCCDYMNQKKKLQKHGAHVFEYLGGKSLHTKTMIIDDDICVVGSCNQDMRSVYLDTEMMLVIRSRELNKTMKEVAKGEIASSKYVLPDGSEIKGENYEERKMSLPKKLLYSVIRVVILPFRHLL